MADDAATGAEELDELAGASLDRYLEAGDLDRARRLYATALSDAPDDPYLLNNYGNCLRVCHDAYGAIHVTG